MPIFCMLRAWGYARVCSIVATEEEVGLGWRLLGQIAHVVWPGGRASVVVSVNASR